MKGKELLGRSQVPPWRQLAMVGEQELVKTRKVKRAD